MERVINSQLELSERISKMYIKFMSMAKEEQSPSYINIKLRLLQQIWNRVEENHHILYNTYDRVELRTTAYETDDIYYTCEEEYTKTNIAMLEALQQFEQKRASTVENFPASVNKFTPIDVKIPAIKIPIFSGSYTDWYSFHDQFISLIHNNEALQEVQKLHYLKMHVVGEAAALLRHIPVTEKNYKQAWEKLKGRYSNRRSIANAYLQRLMSIRNCTNESASAIKYILDTTTDCLSGLNSVGVDTSNWDAIVVYISVNKLDPESLKQWEEKINREKPDNISTFDMLVEFLEYRFRSLEGIQANKNIRTKQIVNSVNKKEAKDIKAKEVTDRMVHHTDTSKIIKCMYCDNEHYLNKCQQFAGLTYKDKMRFVENKQLCYNCLLSNHGVKMCRIKVRCQVCAKKHSTLIHPPPRDDGDQENVILTREVNMASINEQNIQSTEVVEDVISHFVKRSTTYVLLATALVKVKTENGNTILLRALLDQGSEASFITESAAQALGLKKMRSNVQVSGVGDLSTLQSKHVVTFTIESNINNTFTMCMEAYVLKTLTKLLPSKRVRGVWPHIQGLTLADHTYGTPGKIDLLLGAAIYSRVIQHGVVNGPTGTPLAQNTVLGWILSGEVSDVKENTKLPVVSMHSTIVEDSKMLQKFWELESVDSNKLKKKMTEEEIECENIYKNTYRRDEEGRYIVKIPIRDKNIDYGDTFSVARKRLEQLERRLNKEKDLKDEYNRVILEYLELGHMTEVDKKDMNKNTKEIFYLPHHAVVRRDKLTSKVRVVFNASSKLPNGISLNDNMLVGPTIQRELRHIVMTWRKHEIAFVADCIKMYRQIKVTDECANLQRILWKINGSLKEFNLTRVTFGTACAPYLATKTVQQLAYDEQENYPIASKIALKDYYMDDLLSGADNVDKAKEIYKEMSDMMKAGGFQLQKWSSNCSDLVNYIEGAEILADERLIINKQEVIKTLGITWDIKNDKFQYILNLDKNKTDKITKRNILATVARLYDPIGWLAPIIVTAKTFIQKLWLLKIEWDQEIPDTLKDEWVRYKETLYQVKDIKLNRWMNTNDDDIDVELHGYADASSIAYAAVIYIKVFKRNGSIYTNIVTAKTRVAPIKTISVPRLELCGAVLLANLLLETAGQLNVKIDNIYAYSDSKVVLAWLQSHPSRWKTFIANRTAEIIELLPSHHWYYVASENNPADIASRGATPAQLIERTLWWSGPEELRTKTVKLEEQPEVEIKIEERTAKVMTTLTDMGLIELFSRYSSLRKLLRVVAYLLRFTKISKPKHKHLIGDEIDQAMMKCIKVIQNTEYTEEIIALKEGRNISSQSKIRTLNPFLDKDDVLRVGGRLANAHIPEEAKHQIILPCKHPLTKLILLDCHHKTLHGGPMLMISYLRTKFWVTSAKSSLREVLHKCVTCARYRAATAAQLMGELPKDRVTPARPFLNTGVDLAGPIDLRLSKGRGCKTQKGYIVIFICLVTRAIHIEIVTDLTAEAFVAAFKRFVARRGHCKNMWSDNGTNLTAGNKELMSAFEKTIETVRAEIEELLANDGTTWHHIPAAAPHFGGLWEAGVKSIKFHLRRILKNTTLTYEEMSTVTTQIEATLNSRPISPMSDDPSDMNPLTPGHFLIGEAPITVPEQSYLETNVNRLDRWKLAQRMFQNFWERWSREYLSRLQERKKWSKNEPNISIGKLVLLKEDNVPPGKWVMARIIDTHPGKDNLVRVVTVKCKNNILKRPITKVCCLPTD